MKRNGSWLLVLLRGLLVGALAGCAPHPVSKPSALPDAPMRGANAIRIITADSPAFAVRKLTALLVSHGFTVERSSESEWFVLTAPREVAGRRRSLSLQVLAGILDTAGTAHGKADTRLAMSSFGGGYAAFKGKRDDPERQAFALMMAVTQTYPRFGESDPLAEQTLLI